MLTGKFATLSGFYFIAFGFWPFFVKNYRAMKIFSKHQKKFWVILGIMAAAFGLLQFTTKEIPNPPASQPFEGPPEVMNILRRSCYDCHSNETNLVWYDRIAPASWLVSKDIQKARKVLNFSEWGKLTDKQKSGALYNIVNFIMLGAMPLPSYLRLHGHARVTAKELAILKDYAVQQTAGLSPLSDSLDLQSPSGLQWFNNQLDNALAQSKPADQKAADNKVLPSPNGIEYPRGYGNWALISTTDRFDNQTVRAIFGNDVAVKAIEQNKIQPWPDGAVLAKVLWKRTIDSKGLITAGEFIHAEFMIKNATRYASTDGWGWARWVGKDLKPYGKTPAFTAECTNCHAPVKDFDYVFTMPLKLKTPLQ